MNYLLLNNCDCYLKEILAQDFVPEYFTNEVALQNRINEFATIEYDNYGKPFLNFNLLYFALHLNNKHVIIKLPKGK